MKKQLLSARQLGVATFTASLTLATTFAGLDWCGALLAVPVIFALSFCWRGVCSCGCWIAQWNHGKWLASLYILWMVVLGGAVLSRAGSRMTVPMESGAGWVAFLVWIPVVWLALRPSTVFGRTVEIFYLAMLAALALTLGFGMAQIHGSWLLNRQHNFWKSFFCAVGLGCCGVGMPLLWQQNSCDETQRWSGWCGCAALVAALMAFVTNGVLSPTLAAQQERPFFLMTVGLGKTARMEGLVSSVWLFSDVALLAMLLHCCRALLSQFWRKGDKIATSFAAVAMLCLGVWMQDGILAGALLQEVLPFAGLILGGLIPILSWLKRKNQKK